ncbi:MAG TPA: ATP-binding protein [Bryobacteraceae bacterium]|nr:ATP-binding protein [Bryobacteraceae bacterium]HXJ41545.1 ATP-binding protein [Bryobacteraceae bacterium]
MLKFRDYSIKKKLTLMNMLVSGVTLLLACVAFGVYELATLRSNMVKTLSIQAQMVGANSASALLFNDAKSGENTLSALKAAPTVLSSGIYTLAGEPFAVYRRGAGGFVPPIPPMPAGQTEEHWFADKELKLIRSIVFQGKPIGTVYIRSDLQEMNHRLVQYVGIVAAVLSVSLTAAFLLLMAFQRAATRPILQLAETARIVSREKTYSVRAPSTDNHDEVGLLIEAFNEMLVQIQARDAALQTSQEELEQRVTQRTAELDATNKELEAFTYSVAHDLRAPLRHIQGFSNLLVESFGPQLEPEAKKHLQRIGEGTQQMGRLIDDLLSLARIGRQEPRLQATGLNSLVQEVLRDLKTETEGRDIQWQVGDLPFVDCDPGLMKQVFYNLLSNAAKYTRPRKPAVIDIGQVSWEGQLVNFVRDNGVGFNMKYADKLFGVFQRLHRKEDFEGTGVGLATVQRIIHKHGGRIWAEAEIDKGATFFFSLTSQNDGRQRANGPEGGKNGDGKRT